ncbi:MAG: transglutaminase domain-containing protein [Clostridia bacterium]|nr:transglutaminase domain-containing protein [Clostridia bacterium]
MKNAKSRRNFIICIVILGALLLGSIGLNVYYTFWGFDSYLQSTDQIYVMEAGILRNHLMMAPGEDFTFAYDFEHEDYPRLIEQYGIDKTAGAGTELERALRLMDHYAPKLQHKSNYDNHVPVNALALLDYSIGSRQGINCRAKAQILNEMCLALGIHSRKVWIMPYSVYDGDCHVVNEVWDRSLGKWVMLDITNNEYWIDENGLPLSVLEIRQKGALNEFCTPVSPNEPTDNVQKLKEKHMGSFVYIMKNMVYTKYCSAYTAGEVFPVVRLSSEALSVPEERQISQWSCERSPEE